MDKVDQAFSKILEDIGVFRKALLDLPKNKQPEQKALVDVLIEECENGILSTYELTT